MIKIIAQTPRGVTLFLALDRANTDRLHADLPIVVDVRQLLAATEGVTHVDLIVLIAGETLPDVYYQLRAGGLAAVLPETMPDFAP